MHTIICPYHINIIMRNWNFQLWMKQVLPISFSEEADRNFYIPIFADNLTHYLESYGYVFDTRWKSGTHVIAKFLYRIHCEDTKRHVEVVHRNLPEDIDQYHDTVTEDVLLDFLKHWKCIPDFDTDTKFGNTFAIELQKLIWSFIDIEMSPQGRLVSKWLEGSDTESDSGNGTGNANANANAKAKAKAKGKLDSYLQDSYAGYHN